MHFKLNATEKEQNIDWKKKLNQLSSGVRVCDSLNIDFALKIDQNEELKKKELKMEMAEL